MPRNRNLNAGTISRSPLKLAKQVPVYGEEYFGCIRRVVVCFKAPRQEQLVLESYNNQLEVLGTQITHINGLFMPHVPLPTAQDSDVDNGDIVCVMLVQALATLANDELAAILRDVEGLNRANSCPEEWRFSNSADVMLYVVATLKTIIQHQWYKASKLSQECPPALLPTLHADIAFSSEFEAHLWAYEILSNWITNLQVDRQRLVRLFVEIERQSPRSYMSSAVSSRTDLSMNFESDQSMENGALVDPRSNYQQQFLQQRPEQQLPSGDLLWQQPPQQVQLQQVELQQNIDWDPADVLLCDPQSILNMSDFTQPGDMLFDLFDTPNPNFRDFE